MKRLPQFVLMVGILAILPSALLATHNLGGEITVAILDPNKPRLATVTLTTYTDPSDAGVDRCAVNIWVYNTFSGQFVDGLQDIQRKNGPFGPPGNSCPIIVNMIQEGERVKGLIKKNVYRTTYFLPQNGIYTFMYLDNALRGDIVNVPNSIQQNFVVSTQFQFLNNIPDRHTPFFQNHAVENGVIGQELTHFPAAYDPDGDSLVYELIASPTYDSGLPFALNQNPGPLPGYIFPDDTTVFQTNRLSLDPETGFIRWTPLQEGVYFLTYRVVSFTRGQVVLKGFVERNAIFIVGQSPGLNPAINGPAQVTIPAEVASEISFVVTQAKPFDSLYVFQTTDLDGPSGIFSKDIVDNPATINGLVQRFPNMDILIDSFSISADHSTSGNAIPDTVFLAISWNPTLAEVGKTFDLSFYARNDKRYDNPRGTAREVGAHWLTSITVAAPTSRDQPDFMKHVQVWVDPNNQALTFTPQQRPFRWEILDLQGKRVHRGSTLPGEAHIRIHQLARGVYVWKGPGFAKRFFWLP